jgi:hypothetical protein
MPQLPGMAFAPTVEGIFFFLGTIDISDSTVPGLFRFFEVPVALP